MYRSSCRVAVDANEEHSKETINTRISYIQTAPRDMRVFRVRLVLQSNSKKLKPVSREKLWDELFVRQHVCVSLSQSI